MELRHLRYFVMTAQLQSFTKAAEALHIAQPPLGQQIRALEEEIGTRLLERSSRGMVSFGAEVSAQDAENIRSYVIHRAHETQKNQQDAAASAPASSPASIVKP